MPPVLLIFAVLGSILAGIATPTEAAAVGATGALLMAAVRIGAWRRLILASAVALIVLAVAAGAFPVRLQRSDLATIALVAGAIYMGLAIIGLLGIAASLRIVIQKNMI